MASWTDYLQEAALDGVAFPVSSRTVGYGRDGARIRLPYVDGQDVEDTGRLPRTYSLELPLFPGIEGYDDLYPGTYERLVSLAESQRSLTQIVYTDPVHGDVDVRLWSLQEITVADRRDGAMVRIELEEVTFDTTGTTVVRSPARDGEGAARAADDAIASGDVVSEEDVQGAMDSTGPPQTAAQRRGRIAGAPIESLWKDLSTSLTSAALAADEAAAAVDTVRAKLNAIISLPGMESADGWELRGSLLRVIEASGRLAEQAVARAVPTVELTLTGEVSVYELAAGLYRDASRVDDVLRRNSVRDPHAIRVGTVLRVAVR